MERSKIHLVSLQPCSGPIYAMIKPKVVLTQLPTTTCSLSGLRGYLYDRKRGATIQRFANVVGPVIISGHSQPPSPSPSHQATSDTVPSIPFSTIYS